MRLELNREACQGHAVCGMVAPDLVDFDDVEGTAVLLFDVIPNGLEAAAQAAANGCPERALTIVSGRD